MAKRIEMNIKESDSGYEMLYPKSISENIILSSQMNEIYELNNATLDDVLLQLKLGIGNYGYALTVYADNYLVPNVTITGINSLPGKELVTNENGYVFGVSDSANPTISITSPFYDYEDYSEQITSNGVISQIQIKLKKKEPEKGYFAFQNSTNFNLSPNVKSIDICSVGGGGSGSGNASNDRHPQGAGGGGGYVQNILLKEIEKFSFSVVVGSGGNSNGRNGGGSSSLSYQDQSEILCTALGGASSTDGITGGIGNGNGGKGSDDGVYDDTIMGQAGGSGTGYLFNEISLGLAGGGGGGSGTIRSGYFTEPSQYIVTVNGGSPNGATGACSVYSLSNQKYARKEAGQAGIGGGGGGAATAKSLAMGVASSGGNGAVYLRLHY